MKESEPDAIAVLMMANAVQEPISEVSRGKK
jgi:hypothetical protein